MNGRLERRARLVVIDDPGGKFASVDAAVGVQELVTKKPSH
ncbi:MAG: hypothetical protein P8Y93_10935 [Acidobacteriota bacterium]